MSFADEKGSGDRRKSAPPVQGEKTESHRPKKKKGSNPEVGHALRAAYQRTIDEDIPSDLLDLLGKLG